MRADQIALGVHQGLLVQRGDLAAVRAGHLIHGAVVLGVLLVILVLIGVDVADDVVQILVEGFQLVVHLIQGVVVLGDLGGHLLQQVHHGGNDLAVLGVCVKIHAGHQAADVGGLCIQIHSHIQNPP